MWDFLKDGKNVAALTFLGSLIMGMLSIATFMREEVGRDDEKLSEIKGFLFRYADAGQKAWLDVIDRGCRDEAKCESQRRFEGMYPELLVNYSKITDFCDESVEPLQELRCSIFSAYALYDAVEEDKPILGELDCASLYRECMPQLNWGGGQCTSKELQQYWPGIKRGALLISGGESNVNEFRRLYRSLHQEMLEKVGAVMSKMEACQAKLF